MSSLANFLFPHHNHNVHNHNHNHNHKHNLSVLHSNIKYDLHFQQQQRYYLLLTLPGTGTGVSISKASAIRAPKFDINPPNFNDDGDDDLKPRKSKRLRRKKQRQVAWWSDQLNYDDVDVNVQSGFLQQLLDNLFILQVFKSYGWFLPIILVSFLVATGPKSFLMASGIFFGLSIVIFASQKLWQWLDGSPKPRKRRKKRSKSAQRKGVFIEEDDLEEESISGLRNRKRDFQSWVARNNGSFYDKDSTSEAGFKNFGGWDDLVREDKTESPRKPFRETERLERMMKKERLSRSMEERDVPLLLKIMIALFPFLASWTNNMM